METRGKKPSDTLEQIVAEAKERERIINKQHPERHGYGMIQGEADDLIRRIEHLNQNQLKAQTAKVRHREDRVRVMGNDKLYTHSPEDIVIAKLEKQQVSRIEAMVLQEISKRSRDFYFLKDRGLSFTDIAKIYKVHRSTVSRDVNGTNKKLKKYLEELKKEGVNHIFK